MLFLIAGMALASHAAAPVDKRLERAYRQCHFSEQYPSEAVKEIQGKLENAPRAIEVLAQLAKDTRSEIRLLVILLLAELGEQGGATLLWSLLQDDSESVRMAASGALVRLRQIVLAPADIAALKDQRPEVRRLAVATLGRTGDKNILPTLIGAMDDENAMVRMEAVRAASVKRDPTSEQAFIKRLQDPSVEVRTAAAGALSAYKSPEAIKALETALKDTDWHVRAAAVSALGTRNGPVSSQAKISEAIIDILRSDEFALVRDRAADALTFANADQTVKALVDSMVSDDRNVSFHATRAMCAGRCIGALPELTKHLTNSHAEVRGQIMDVFGALGGTNQLTAVNEAINDPSPIVRLAAVDALQKIGERTGAKTLMDKLNDANPHVRAAATRAIGRLQEKDATSKLIPLLHDENSFVRSAAAEALGKLGDRSAVPALIALLTKLDAPDGGEAGLVLKTKNDILADKIKLDVIKQKGVVATALGELRSPEAVEPLIKHGLKSTSIELQATAAYSLGHIGDSRAVNPLQDAVRVYYEQLTQQGTAGLVIQDGSGTGVTAWRRDREKEARVRAAVIWALGQIGDPAAQPLLSRALNDDNSLVRDNAAEALAKFREKQERDQRLAEMRAKTPLNEQPAPAPGKSRSGSASQNQ